jgi:hypothetical protein
MGDRKSLENGKKKKGKLVVGHILTTKQILILMSTSYIWRERILMTCF